MILNKYIIIIKYIRDHKLNILYLKYVLTLIEFYKDMILNKITKIRLIKTTIRLLIIPIKQNKNNIIVFNFSKII